MDLDAAAVSGAWTASVTGVGAIITAPEAMSIWLWLVGTIITAMLSTASALLVGLAVAWYKDKLEARRRETERMFKDSVD